MRSPGGSGVRSGREGTWLGGVTSHIVAGYLPVVPLGRGEAAGGRIQEVEGGS